MTSTRAHISDDNTHGTNAMNTACVCTCHMPNASNTSLAGGGGGGGEVRRRRALLLLLHVTLCPHVPRLTPSADLHEFRLKKTNRKLLQHSILDAGHRGLTHPHAMDSLDMGCTVASLIEPWLSLELRMIRLGRSMSTAPLEGPRVLRQVKTASVPAVDL